MVEALLSDLMGPATARFLVTVLNLASFCGTSSARFLLLRGEKDGGVVMFEALLSYLMGLSLARFLVNALLSVEVEVEVEALLSVPARFLVTAMLSNLRNSVFCIFLASGAS